MRRPWTKREDAVLRKRYPNERTTDVAAVLGRGVGPTYQRAAILGIKKSPEYLAGPLACRLRRGGDVGAAHRFKPGQTPANKGLRRPGWAPGRMSHTQFKKGQMRGAAQSNYLPIGSERISKDGYLERKVTDDHPVPARRWVGVHRLLWEEFLGPVPPGFVVIFKNGDKRDVRIDNLQLLSQGENMRRNTLHRYPKEIALAMQLKGALQRQINKRMRA